MSRYLPDNTKTGDFNPRRTHSGSFFIIHEQLASIRVVVLSFTANKQTNTLKYMHIYIYIYIYIYTYNYICGSPEKLHLIPY